MSDQMKSPSFEVLLHSALDEYKENKMFFGVAVSRLGHKDISPIGPAAGPHTQLAHNCVAAFGAGANHLELKTVQILEGEALGISKPCIDTKYEVYNSEWSTELTIEAALDEYIKAYMLIYVLAIEYDLAKPEDVSYYMSVGYDLKGIRSDKVDNFINKMINPSQTLEWQKNIEYLKSYHGLFSRVTMADILEMPAMISNTMALSTMHGCDKEEIEAIGTYLMKEKGLNTFIKMNPTLLGQGDIRQVLDDIGYKELEVDPHMFEVDMTFEQGIRLIKNMNLVAASEGVRFGVKLTNTLPVKNTLKKLGGEFVYLSGPALYPIAINVAYRIAKAFDGAVRISYSGGADTGNIKSIVETGIYPVTVSSILLKPGGYKNISRMNKALEGLRHVPQIDLVALEELAALARVGGQYMKQELKCFDPSSNYDLLCAKCNNCIDVCPNRANEKVMVSDKKYVVHHDDLCNECGNCSPFCIEGREPYREKWTLFGDEASFMDSNNEGVCPVGDTFKYRFRDTRNQELINQMKNIEMTYKV